MFGCHVKTINGMLDKKNNNSTRNYKTRTINVAFCNVNVQKQSQMDIFEGPPGFFYF